MNPKTVLIFCFAYVIGLLSTAAFAFSSDNPSPIAIAITIGILITITSIAAILVPRFLWIGKDLKLWIIAGAIAILALGYFQLRVPHPSVIDISQLVSQEQNKREIYVTVRGKISDRPRLTRSQKIQFLLNSEQVSVHQSKEFSNSGFKKATGKLYVTLPEDGTIGLYSDRRVYVTGKLYKPQSALNPGAFDFKNYLARQGVFAGLKGKKVSFAKGNEPWFALWKLQKTIVNAQKIGLGDRVGSLLASMVLGAKAVDIPYELRDRMTKAGLAHVFAASGFQVSLLLGVAIALTKTFSRGIQFIFGLSILIFYIGLTGIQPSILRAGLMGVGVLVGMLMERQVKPLASLFLSAIILLLFNPLWIWDLSFQLSFLATFGLVSTASTLQKKLDWIPSAIASIIAIPIAASIWTLPLLIFVFNTIATYSIPINVIVTPLISVISLGGMISATAALIIPVAGSAIAWLLYYPTSLLIWLVEFFTSLPGSSLAIGKIPLSIMVLIYGLMVAIWLNKWCQKRWWLIGLFALTLTIMPIWYWRSTLVQVTVLAAKNEPVVVIQNKGQTILVNSGDADTARYTVIPFLAQQGVNKIDRAIALEENGNLNSGWIEVNKNIAIVDFYTNLDAKSIRRLRGSAIDSNLKASHIQKLAIDENISTASTKLSLINADSLQFQLAGQTWLLLNSRYNSTFQNVNRLKSQILLWNGKDLESNWLKIIQPQIAISSSDRIAKETLNKLERENIHLYLTSRDGAIEWNPKNRFQKTIDKEQENLV
jgi:competence protein ComEC